MWRHLNGSEGGHALWLPAEHLGTHGVVVGMTGSGKTGLVTVMIEEAARAQVPTVVIDVKGDLPNLLLAFPDFGASALEPWIEMERDGMSREEVAARAAELADKPREARRMGDRRAGACGVHGGHECKGTYTGRHRGRAAARVVITRAALAALGLGSGGGAECADGGGVARTAAVGERA